MSICGLQRTRPALVSLGLMAASLALTPGLAADEGLEIKGFKTHRVILLDAADGKVIGRMSEDELADDLPYKVLSRADNGRLLTVIDGERVWLLPHQVDTGKKPDLAEATTSCVAVKESGYATTRALGDCGE